MAVYRVDADTRREVLLTRPAGDIPAQYLRVPIAILAMAAGAQDMVNIRFPPRTFGELADELRSVGIDLRSQVNHRLREWVNRAWSAGPPAGPRRDPEQLGSRLGVIVTFQVRNERSTTTDAIELRAFLTDISMAELGVKLGCLAKSPDGTHGQLLISSDGSAANEVELLCCDVHLALDRNLASAVSGLPAPDARPVTLLGAGAIGSHVSNSLAREGLFTWTVIDDDHMLPHNPPRHALLSSDVGRAKAPALAMHLDRALAQPGATKSIVANVLDPEDVNAAAVRQSLADAELILDASASVAVSRHLADFPVAARRTSFFFNPDGTDGVLLIEPKDRSITPRDLEAQYYGLLVTDPRLEGHLRTSEERIAYSGACRQATNTMPESWVAALSALIAMELKEAIWDAEGRIVIWRTSGAESRCIRAAADCWELTRFGSWRVYLSSILAADLASRRARQLPAETGGVLLGVVDGEAKSIHACVALGAPVDSIGSAAGFERGTSGLREQIATHAAATLGQLSYVGEWHSHPIEYPTSPSVTDLLQLTELARLLDMNAVPAVMAIVGDDGTRIHTGNIVDVGIPLTVIKVAEHAR